ncbi:MAG TPA: four helix bundle protein [Bacteroidetes bacterium]|nr:four helix bundle protein [Bacteroidota bacterium]
MKYTLENLDVYNLAETFSDKIWNEVVNWKYFEKDTVGKQWVRSTDSISANIAEGYGRFTFKEDKRFLHISRGSLLESKSWLNKAARRNLISKEIFDSLFLEIEILHQKLNAYINFVERANSKTTELAASNKPIN